MATGWAVGQAGLWTVMLMMAFGHVMALLTCASLSAICTNGEVGGPHPRPKTPRL